MNRLKLVCGLIMSFVFLAGCGLAQTPAVSAAPTRIPSPTAAPLATSLPPTQLLSPIPKASPTSLPQLTEAQLKNGSYRTPQYQKQVKLENGTYQGGSGPDALTAILLPQIAFGDLDQDGSEDAAVLLAENGGGSGTFVSLMVLYNQAGTARQAGTVLIDDRPKIQTLTIQDGKIILNAIIHGPGDIMPKPTLTVEEVYQPAGDGLNLIRFESQPADGARRSIQIDQPANASPVSGKILTRGSLPVAPFENNLAYRIVSNQGKVLLQGAFLVKADQPGGPATFEQEIDLGALAGSGAVRLELFEVSMADGSTVALNSVALQVK